MRPIVALLKTPCPCKYISKFNLAWSMNRNNIQTLTPKAENWDKSVSVNEKDLGIEDPTKGIK